MDKEYYTPDKTKFWFWLGPGYPIFMLLVIVVMIAYGLSL